VGDSGVPQLEGAVAVLVLSGCVGFEPYGAEGVSWGQARVGVQGGG
jgi:hypothetical protein